MDNQNHKKRTFVFTDIQDSTFLAGKLEGLYSRLLSMYRNLVREVIKKNRGEEIDCAGDGFFIAFLHSIDAARAAVEMQKKIKASVWPGNAELKVRIGIHTGPALLAEAGYTGLTIHKTSRICDAAHGGQTLMSHSTASEVLSNPDPGFEMNSLGRFHLKGFETPEEIFQLQVEGLQETFPAPRILPALPVVAVLPFQDVHNNPEDAYFFEGISTDMIHALARVPGLRVIARSASSVFHGATEDIISIGKKLKANAILHGKMEKVDHQISLNVVLTDIGKNEALWSSEIKGNLNDIFEIEDEIVVQAARSLGIQYQHASVMKAGPQFSIQNIEAYDYYLKGRRFYYQFSQQSVFFGLQMFQKAIQIDPNFALAYAGAADCYSYLYMYEDPSPAHLAAAEQMSQKAIELSPSLAEAHACRGAALSLSKNFEAAEACFEKAIDLDPQLFEAYYLYARVAFASGDLQKAAGLFRDANRVRPDDYQSLLLAAQCFEKMGFSARAKEVREDGVDIVEQHIKLNPGDVRALYLGANGQAALGNHVLASKWLQRALTLEPDDPMLLYNAGCIYALMEMEEEALESLDSSVDAGLTQKEWFVNDPDLNGLRKHERFAQILNKLDRVVGPGKTS